MGRTKYRETKTILDASRVARVAASSQMQPHPLPSSRFGGRGEGAPQRENPPARRGKIPEYRRVFHISPHALCFDGELRERPDEGATTDETATWRPRDRWPSPAAPAYARLIPLRTARLRSAATRRRESRQMSGPRWRNAAPRNLLPRLRAPAWPASFLPACLVIDTRLSPSVVQLATPLAGRRQLSIQMRQTPLSDHPKCEPPAVEGSPRRRSITSTRQRRLLSLYLSFHLACGVYLSISLRRSTRRSADWDGRGRR